MASRSLPVRPLAGAVALALAACAGPGDAPPGAGGAGPDAAASRTRPAASDEAALRSDSVVALLDLLDALVAVSPDHESERVALQALDGDRRQALLAELIARNESDATVQRAIDAFLATEARRIYLERYRNVSADDIRRVLNALPWVALGAPGDIGRPWLEAIPIRSGLREWVARLTERIDLAAARDSAVRWLPEGTYPVPEMFLVYDGNAGSYTADGKAFYNLYSDIVRELPPGQGPGFDRLDEMQQVIAHEMQHVLAEPLFLETWSGTGDWRTAAREAVVAGMVSEGVAIHCNPPVGMHREFWESTDSLAVLISELNRTFRALDAGELDEEAFRAWYGGTFQELPRRLLREHLERRHPDDEVEALLLESQPHRPDLLHALGWWMVGHVSGALPRPAGSPDTIGPADPAATRALLADPQSLLARYNEALGPGPDSLRVDPRLLRP